MILEPGQVGVLKEVGETYILHAAITPMIDVFSELTFRSHCLSLSARLGNCLDDATPF